MSVAFLLEFAILYLAVNCIDKHIQTKADQVALIWEKDEPGQTEFITYHQLLSEVPVCMSWHLSATPCHTVDHIFPLNKGLQDGQLVAAVGSAQVRRGDAVHAHGASGRVCHAGLRPPWSRPQVSPWPAPLWLAMQICD